MEIEEIIATMEALLSNLPPAKNARIRVLDVADGKEVWMDIKDLKALRFGDSDGATNVLAFIVDSTNKR